MRGNLKNSRTIHRGWFGFRYLSHRYSNTRLTEDASRLSRRCAQRNGFSCHPTATTCGAGLAAGRPPTAAGPEGQRDCPGLSWADPATWSFFGMFRVTKCVWECVVFSARIWDFSLEKLGMVSATSPRLGGC